MTVSVAALYGIQYLVWPHNYSATTPLQRLWSWGALVWLGAVLPGACGMIGMLLYRHPRGLDKVRPVQQLISWRIVSRGTNVEALLQTIRRCQREMARTPLFPYVIEVVTDTRDLSLAPPNDDVVHLAVPQWYTTPNGSLYKARALQWAVEHSRLPDDAWIVHLDEETQPTSSGIKGIARMIAEEEASGRLRIGQGAILYHRSWREHPFLTLADNVRTGDDFARFHFAHRVGITIFGLHGSYIVVRNDVEKATGFDFGPAGSITEDAFWAVVNMQEGRRCRWVEGYLEEQSTQSIGDFLKQRRRWYQGLAKVSLFAPVKLRYRIAIGANTALWTLAPFAIIYTLAHFALSGYIPPWVRFLANCSFASFITLYITGLRANLREHGISQPVKRAGWWLAQVLLLPAFSLLEATGIVMALVKPGSGFHVVKK